MPIKVGTVYIEVEPDVSNFGDRIDKGLDAEQGKIGRAASKIGDTISEKLGFGREKNRVDDLGSAISMSLGGASTSVVAFGKDSDRTSVSVDRIGDRMTKFNTNMRAFQNIISLIKIPAAFAGLGVAASGLLAVAAGGIAVVSSLAPLAGLVVAMPAGMFAIGAAAVTVSLAFNGVSEAMKGTKGAMEKLGPAGKEFVTFLKGLKPLKEDLQVIASKNLLPGITAGMKSAFSPGNISAVKTIIGDTATSLGNLTEKLGKELGKPGWAAALREIGETNTIVFDKLGGSIINAAAGWRDLFMAAQPFIRWMIEGTSRLIEMGGAWAKNTAETGKVAGFFRETKEIMQILGGIIGGLVSSLIDIGKAAYPLGKTILKGLNSELGKLSDWAGSEGGKQTLKTYFDSAEPVLASVWRLFKALAGVLLSVGKAASDSGLDVFLDRISKEVLPLLEGGLKTAVSDLAGPFFDLAISLGKIAATLLGSSAPLKVFVQALANGASKISDLLSNNPKLAEFVVIFSSILAISKIINFSGMVTGIMSTVAALRTQSIAADGTTRSQWSLNAAMRANPIGLIVTALQLLAVGLFMAWQHSETFRNAVKALGGVASTVFSTVVGAAESVFNFFKDNWQLLTLLLGAPFFAVVALATDAFGVRSALVGAFTAVKDWVSEKLDDIAGFFARLPGRLAATLGSLASTALTPIKNAFTSVKDWVGQKLVDIVTFYINLPGRLWDAYWATAASIKEKFKGYFTDIKDWVSAKVDQIVNFFVNLPGRLADLVGNLKSKGTDLLAGAFSPIGNALDGIQIGIQWLRDKATSVLDDAWKKIKVPLGLVASAVGGIKEGFEKMKEVLVWLKNNVESILEKISGPLGKVADILDKVPLVGDVAVGMNSLAAKAARNNTPGVDSGGLAPRASMLLGSIMSMFGGVRLSSGFRTTAQNEAAGGAPNSDHLTGKAIDLVPSAGWNAGTVALFDKIAAWAASQDFIRWIGWRGVKNHGPGHHLHLSTFGDGGTLAPGQLGIVGEAGVEIIKAGRTGATVTPVQDGEMHFHFPSTVPYTRDQANAVKDMVIEAIRSAPHRGVSTLRPGV